MDSKNLSNCSLGEEFWAEFDSVDESGEIDEENSPNKSIDEEEGAAEADWLKEAGLEDFVHSLEGNEIRSSSSLENLLLLSVSVPLTERQANTVKKRFNTLRTTLSKQRAEGQDFVHLIATSKHRPDVRSLFNLSDDASTQSVDIPKTEISERDGNAFSAQKYGLDVPNESIPRRSSSPDLQHMSRGRTNSTPTDYGKLKGVESSNKTNNNNNNNNNLLSVSKSNMKKEPSRFSWSGYKKAFKVNSDRRNSSSVLDSESNDTGIEMLSLKYKSSLRRQSSQRDDDKNNKQLSEAEVNNNYFNGDYITAEGLGIEILGDPQTNCPQVIIDLRLNPYAVRIEDLDSDIRKKVRTLALIELSTVLDMYGLEYEKIKQRKFRKKIKKNSNNYLFGVPLIDLYNRDQIRDSNISIPSVLNVLISYIRINGLHEEGIFRITGSQNRVQGLKEELSNLYQYYYVNCLKENNEEIFALLNKYSIYDVSSLLKHFIRDLPDPILSSQLLEAFLLVPKVNHYLQQIQILNLLILLMNDCHRNSLEAILTLLNDIIIHEHLNKMTIHNIATIMAPNLFPNLANKKITKGGEHREMVLMLERANHSLLLTKMMIANQLAVFHVPPYLISQAQRRKK